jgi:hypothetical protein
MPEYRRVVQEIWIREAAQCMVAPSMHLVLPGNEKHVYAVRLVEAGAESMVDWLYLDRSVMNFEQRNDAWSFCGK